jgi:N-acetylglutamate synthase-like GNAT family acetyltransferase
MMRVREAVKSDVQRLAGLNQAFNGVTRSSEDIGRVLEAEGSHETILVAEDEGEVVGFACLQTLDSFCYAAPWTEITELYVVPASRRSGAGTGLVDEAIRRAAEIGASEVLVRTNIENEAAKCLFAQRGLELAPHLVFHRSTQSA